MHQLVRQLRRWQVREWQYRAAWGVARWVAVVAGGFAVCAFADWMIDRYTDTPFWLRVLMSLGQLVLYVVAAWHFIWKLRVPSLDALAGRAEDDEPRFGHRLVTALQLNRPAAKTDGMSKELIADVTREAEGMSSRLDLATLADKWRAEYSALVLVPLLCVATLFYVVRPGLVTALVERQLLQDADIPRSVAIENTTPELWPSGDEVTLSFRVTGRFTEESVGSATVSPDGQPAETYPVAFAGLIDSDTARFTAVVPPSSAPFMFKARLHDGRTRKPAAVRFEPRPVVTDVNAWLRLPVYVDPAGVRRYERFQPQGEVTALPACGLRIEASASKPLKTADVVVLTRDATGAEKEAARFPMTLADDRQSAAVSFDIPAKASGYRVVVTDDNGFANLTPPRRGIAAAPDDPPRVNLLAEVLKDPREPGPIEDYEVTGMPLVLGGQVQVAYAARSPLGLSRAFVVYRVNDGEWTQLPLKDTVADLEKLGRFLPELGVFENSGPYGQVEFYQLPPADPETAPPGLEAGGRYNFQTAALRKAIPGGDAPLTVGDRVEFYVAVHDRVPDASRPAGKSESRIKAVVSQSQLEDWNRQRDQSRERLKQLEERQRGVFTRERP